MFGVQPFMECCARTGHLSAMRWALCEMVELCAVGIFRRSGKPLAFEPGSFYRGFFGCLGS